MFDTLQDRLSAAFRNLRGKTRLSEAEIEATLREIRLALLEADVNLTVVKEFTAAVRTRAAGAEIHFSPSTDSVLVGDLFDVVLQGANFDSTSGGLPIDKITGGQGFNFSYSFANMQVLSITIDPRWTLGSNPGVIDLRPCTSDDLIVIRLQFDLHDSIKTSFARRELALVSGSLKEFGVLVRNRLLTENMRLYIYLQQKMAGDEVNTALVRSFRKEMDGIAKTALEFLEKYNEIEKKSEAELSSFAEEFDQIGSVVSTRMKREEETLYPLYAANY